MNLRHTLLATLVAAAWGFNFVVIHVGIGDFPPLLFSALRFTLAAIPLVFFIRKPDVPWRIILGIGGMLGVVKFSLLFIGMDVGLSAGLASLVLQTQAFFTIILAGLILGERPSGGQLAGMFVAFSGIALVASTVSGDLSALGLSLAIASALAWACSNLIMKKAGPADMLSLMVWVSLVPPLPLMLLSFLFEGGDAIVAAFQNLRLVGVGATLYIAFVATIFGFAVWGKLINIYGAAKVAPYSLLVPTFGMSFSSLFLGEEFGPLRLIAAALVICGLTINQLSGRKSVSLKPAE